MPGRERTCPMGAGSRTGRGMGYCTGTPPDPAIGSRFGFRRGRGGMGRGWRHRFYAIGAPGRVAPTPESEVADLKAQADWLKGQLDAVQRRLDEFESK
jgi:hypothetical protein